jgi:hypothetical protein
LYKVTKIHKIPQLRTGAKRLIFFGTLCDVPEKCRVPTQVEAVPGREEIENAQLFAPQMCSITRCGGAMD